MIDTRMGILLQMAKKGKDNKREVAHEAKIGESTFYNLVNNNSTRIDFQVLEKLCIYFDCQPGDILTLLPNKEKVEPAT